MLQLAGIARNPNAHGAGGGEARGHDVPEKPAIPWWNALVPQRWKNKSLPTKLQLLQERVQQDRNMSDLKRQDNKLLKDRFKLLGLLLLMALYFIFLYIAVVQTLVLSGKVEARSWFSLSVFLLFAQHYATSMLLACAKEGWTKLLDWPFSSAAVTTDSTSAGSSSIIQAAMHILMISIGMLPFVPFLDIYTFACMTIRLCIYTFQPGKASTKYYTKKVFNPMREVQKMIACPIRMPSDSHPRVDLPVALIPWQQKYMEMRVALAGAVYVLPMAVIAIYLLMHCGYLEDANCLTLTEEYFLWGTCGIAFVYMAASYKGYVKEKILKKYKYWTDWTLPGVVVRELQDFGLYFSDIILDIIVIQAWWQAGTTWMLALGLVFLLLQYVVSSAALLYALTASDNERNDLPLQLNNGMGHRRPNTNMQLHTLPGKLVWGWFVTMVSLPLLDIFSAFRLVLSAFQEAAKQMNVKEDTADADTVNKDTANTDTGKEDTARRANSTWEMKCVKNMITWLFIVPVASVFWVLHVVLAGVVLTQLKKFAPDICNKIFGPVEHIQRWSMVTGLATRNQAPVTVPGAGQRDQQQPQRAPEDIADDAACQWAENFKFARQPAEAYLEAFPQVLLQTIVYFAGPTDARPALIVVMTSIVLSLLNLFKALDVMHQAGRNVGLTLWQEIWRVLQLNGAYRVSAHRLTDEMPESFENHYERVFLKLGDLDGKSLSIVQQASLLAARIQTSREKATGSDWVLHLIDLNCGSGEKGKPIPMLGMALLDAPDDHLLALWKVELRNPVLNIRFCNKLTQALWKVEAERCPGHHIVLALFFANPEPQDDARRRTVNPLDGCKYLPSLPHLHRLTLQYFKQGLPEDVADPAIATALRNATHIDQLSFHECGRMHAVVDWIVMAHGMTWLRRLELAYCDPISDYGTENEPSLGESLASLTQLEFLMISGCHRLTALPEVVCQLPNLRWLDVHCLQTNIKLRGDPQFERIPESISNLTKLEALSLTGLPKLRSIPGSLAQCTALQKLYIGGSDPLLQYSDEVEQLKAQGVTVDVDRTGELVYWM